VRESTRGPGITLACLSGEQCRVIVEPWGSEHILKRGDIVFVESSAFLTGDVDVTYESDGLSLAFMSDAPVLITDQNGNRWEI
jgi:hypothetical protein